MKTLGQVSAKYAAGGYGLNMAQCDECARIELAIHEEVAAMALPPARRAVTNVIQLAPAGSGLRLTSRGRMRQSACNGAETTKARNRMAKAAKAAKARPLMDPRYLDPRFSVRVDHMGRHFGSFGEMCQRWRVRPELVAMRLGMGMELGRALTTPPRKA